MKKIFLMLAAMGLIMSSCQKDENLGGSTGETLVTVTASVPQAVGVRAAGVGSDKGGVANVLAQHDLRYILWVYEGDATEPVKKLDPWTAKDQTSATMRLIPGHTYTFVAWADFSENGTATADWHYNTSAFPEITEIDHAINDETRDAYFVAKTVKVGENDNITLTLKRPFGKVRMITTDWNESAVQTLNPTDVKITYNEDLYKGINIKSGELLAAKSTAATYEAKIGTYAEAAENEKTLFVDYLFGLPVADATATAETVEQYPITFDIETVGVRTYEVKTAVPVTRNWLTTVKGNILTTNTNININVDPNFDNEHTTTSRQALELAAINGGDVTLTEDVVLDETLEIKANMTIDLNGKTITGAVNPNDNTKHIYPINNYGNLTIKGGTIEGRGIYNQAGATLTIDNATINALDWNGGACIWGYGADSKVYLNNATLTGNTGVVSSEGYVEINGGTYTCYSGITDDGTQKTSPTYNIRAYNGLKITDGTFTSRHGVISAGGGETVIEGGSYTIQFNAATTSNVVYVYGNADMTINGGSFISDNSSNKADSGAAVLVSGSNAKATIYDGTFVGMNGMVSGNAKLYGGTYNTVLNYNHYDKLENLIADGYVASQNTDGSWSVVKGTTVQDAAEFITAINDVEEGGVIALNADVNFTTENRTPNSGTWYEGIYYTGDKSFTIDLGGKNIKNESGAVNDYMLLFKNDGTKASTITIKNGTIDAGTAAYCAVCTSSTSTAPITINLENVELINNNMNGATAKIRGGAILNVKAGTKITGKDSYTCLEIVASTVNVYEGAEFYQNGTSSYVGSLIGVSSGGTANVYGGKGVSKKCGLAVYSTGGTINAMGGEWTANVDGTVPTPQGDNSLNVLLVQNDTNQTYWRAPSIMNVTGGTYKGGMSATEYTATSSAKLEISGGTFNADPSGYLESGKTATESNGTWTVQ